jgi:KDO2-lipid IV(A) lauroyltransferase
MDDSTPAASLRARVRYDGLWWRKFAYLGCVYGPEWWKRYSPPVIAAIIFALIGRNRRGAVTNLARITGDEDPRYALRMFADFAHCLTETMEYYGPRPAPLRLDLPASDPLRDALQRGRGAVIVTGHFGNWDIAGKLLHEYDRPINMVMAREANASTHDYIQQARARGGVRIIYSDSSVFSSLNMIHALHQNEILALQLDRMLGMSRARLVPFFGTPALFPTGPFVLARLADAPIIPVFVPRLGIRHYGVRVAGPFSIPHERTDPNVIDHVMAAVVREFESVVREFPTQWFQFAPFWPQVPGVDVPHPAEADTTVEEPVRARRR